MQTGRRRLNSYKGEIELLCLDAVCLFSAGGGGEATNSKGRLLHLIGRCGIEDTGLQWAEAVKVVVVTLVQMWVSFTVNHWL